MHLADRGYALIVLTALLAIAGLWSAEPALDGAWYWGALVLLVGLTLEGFLLSRTRIETEVETAPRALLGREQPAAFAFHNASNVQASFEFFGGCSLLQGVLGSFRNCAAAGLDNPWRLDPCGTQVLKLLSLQFNRDAHDQAPA